MDALVGALAPRAFLLTAGETDSLFPIDGVRSIVEKTQIAYAQEDVPERFGAILFHQALAPDDVKAAAYGFLDHWLT